MDNLFVLQHLVPHLIKVTKRDAAPMFQIREHLLGRHSIVLVYAGSGVFRLDGVSHTVQRGNLIYSPPGVLRQINAGSDSSFHYFSAGFLYTCPMARKNEWIYLEPPLPFQAVDRISDEYLFSRLLDLFDELYKTWLSDLPTSLAYCRAIFTEIIILLAMWKTGDRIVYDRVRKVEKVIKYMAENHERQLSLEELAHVNKISPSYLGNIFKQVTGKPPVGYLIKMRMNKAKDLLDDGYSVTETAAKLGFNDVSYFSRCFMKHEGMRPNQYRLKRKS